jgi:UDP-3-O-[3-hydroxymyristoyl] glucosamine N-acyltransferase
MPELSVSELSRLIAGEVEGDGERIVRGVAPLEGAGPDDLSFVANPRYLRYLPTTAAGAVLLPRALDSAPPAGVVAIRVDDPYAALAAVLPVLYPERTDPPEIHPTAVIGEEAELGEGVTIGAYAVIGRRVRIGDRCRIAAHVVIGDDCVLGADSLLHPQCTLYPGVRLGERCVIHGGARLGSDGFGFALVQGAQRKIPQVGGCVLGDDVEVGANTTIDRGSVGDTVVGSGTKIDNLVQIGHNCRIGQHVLLISQVGVAGSTTVGDHAILGGQVGVQGHIRIGAGARVGGQAGVIGDVPDGANVSGYPARPHREALRAQAALLRLPELVQKLRRLERVVFGRDDQASGAG